MNKKTLLLAGISILSLNVQADKSYGTDKKIISYGELGHQKSLAEIKRDFFNAQVETSKASMIADGSVTIAERLLASAKTHLDNLKKIPASNKLKVEGSEAMKTQYDKDAIKSAEDAVEAAQNKLTAEKAKKAEADASGKAYLASIEAALRKAGADASEKASLASIKAAAAPNFSESEKLAQESAARGAAAAPIFSESEKIAQESAARGAARVSEAQKQLDDFRKEMAARKAEQLARHAAELEASKERIKAENLKIMQASGYYKKI